MQYVELAKVVLAVLAFLLDVIRERREGEASDANVLVDKGVGLLQSIGKISKVKELESLDLTELKPIIAELISKVHALRIDK